MMCELVVKEANNAWRWFHCLLGLQRWLHSIIFDETDDMRHLVFDTRHGSRTSRAVSLQQAVPT
jgi:hypothetical protein